MQQLKGACLTKLRSAHLIWPYGDTEASDCRRRWAERSVHCTLVIRTQWTWVL